jgi:hypothetical protein
MPERVPDLFRTALRGARECNSRWRASDRRQSRALYRRARANQIQRGGTELKSLGRLCARD